MLKFSLTILLSTIGLVSFSQTNPSELSEIFERKGLRLIANVELNENDLNEILAFNYDNYRKSNSSVFVRVVNGPNLELFSINRIATGKKDAQVKEDKVSEDEHTSPVLRKIEIIEIDVFNSSRSHEIDK